MLGPKTPSRPLCPLLPNAPQAIRILRHDEAESLFDIDELYDDSDLSGGDGSEVDNDDAVAKVNAQLNDVPPQFTSFYTSVVTGIEDTQIPISFTSLLAQSNATDTDGTVVAFDIKAVTSGTLLIGTDAASATAWNASTNYTIDATHQAFWTPDPSSTGSLNAFTAVAKDNIGLESSTPVQATIQVTPPNYAPTLTSFSATIASGNQDTQIPISFTHLLAQSNATDADGSVVAFDVKAVTSGTLLIGADAATATPWDATTNFTVDATHQAFWTPNANANGTLNAFTAVARDNGGLESATPVQTNVAVMPYYPPVAVDDSVTILNGLQISGSTSNLTDVAQNYLLTQGNTLVNGLGTPSDGSSAATFGENYLPRNDDGSSSAINISSVFSSGINFFGTSYSSIYVNNNGSISFNQPIGQYTPSQITSGSTPIIAPFWADVDTRSGGSTFSTGGNSTGSNLVYYDLDPTNGVITVTWDDVGYYSGHTDKVDAFQLQLISRGIGDFDIVMRYQTINWVTGDASRGSGGLNGVVAVAGYSAGDGNPAHYYELPQSSNQADMLGLGNTVGNTGRVGTYEYSVRNGVVVTNNNVLTNDIDVNGYALTVSAVNGNSLNVGQPITLNHGILTLNTDGSYSYEVNTNDPAYINMLADQTISDVASYTVSDGKGGYSTANLTINIAGYNHTPTLTSFVSAIATGNEDTQIPISFTNLLAQSNATDIDGSVVGFNVKAITSGTLLIGANAATATPWNASNNFTVDATHQAFWTPDANAIGIQNAFTAVAKDNLGLESSTSVQATVNVAVTHGSVATFLANISNIGSTGFSITDTSTNITANLDNLQTYFAKLSSITVTDNGAITLTVAQLTADNNVLALLSPSTYSLSVIGVTIADLDSAYLGLLDKVTSITLASGFTSLSYAEFSNANGKLVNTGLTITDVSVADAAVVVNDSHIIAITVIGANTTDLADLAGLSKVTSIALASGITSLSYAQYSNASDKLTSTVFFSKLSTLWMVKTHRCFLHRKRHF